MLELVEGSLQYHCRTRLIANVVPGWLDVCPAARHLPTAPTESEAEDPPDTEPEEEPQVG